MKDYLWVFILSIIAILSSGMFLGTISKSSMLVKKLKFSRANLLINFTLLITSLVNIGLIVYVFLLVREQISNLT